MNWDGEMELLYVDDEPALLELGKEFLELEPDVNVTTLQSPVDALAMLSDKHFDIIISDYMMPAMNGLEFFKRLRISGISTPFILFTGKGREEVVIDAMRHGVDFYIKKGGDAKSQFAELINAIRQCTARKEAEEALEHNARRFRTMIENQSEIIALSDLTGNLKFVSSSMKRILGYDPEELIGSNITSIFVDPSAFDSRPRIGQPGMPRDLTFRLEADLKHANGSVISMEMTGRILTKDGIPHEVVVNAYDITERKRDERRIRHLISVQKAIRQVNKCITSETDPIKLLKSVCDIAVERGYSTAWAAIFSDGRNPVRVVETGIGPTFDKVRSILDSGRQLSCTDSVVAINDIYVNKTPPETCIDCPLNSFPTDHIHVAKPLIYSGHTFGQFSVTLPTELFSPEELSVLGEIAEDLSFALHYLIQGHEKDEFNISMLKMKQMFYDMFARMHRPTLVVGRDAYGQGAGQQFRVEGASQAFLDVTGFDRTIIGMEIDVLSDNVSDGKELVQVIDDVISTRIPQSVSVHSVRDDEEYVAFVFAPGADYAGVMLIPTGTPERLLSIGRGV
jgi:PAS domain S-box-containing protein